MNDPLQAVNVHPSRPAIPSAAGLVRFALPVFALTIALSAFLLLGVQPMFTKMVIPRLGGTPAVWSVAIVFFQALLLAGYLYAHVLCNKLSLRRAVIVQVALMAVVAAAWLPIAFDPGWGRPPEQGQALWLIMVFAVSVGLPFFVVSANGPLLQAWYATTGRPDADDPYFLYGASNFGSFLALLSYPFVIEPYLTLHAQSDLWSYGFALLAVGIAACGVVALSIGGSGSAAKVRAETPAAAPVPVSSVMAWIGLAFVPSALLVAVTSYIATDIAAVPLLWIVPLALYLLSFVIAFSAAGERFAGKLLAIQPALAALIPLCALLPGHLFLWLHVAFFFVSATICHSQLYRLRPQAQSLSTFYCYLSFGGLLGGIFASLLAPALFNSVLEYPILIVAALACRPKMIESVRSLGLARLVTGIIIVALAIGLVFLIGPHMPTLFWLVCIGVLAVVMMLSREAPARLVAVAAVALALIEVAARTDTLERVRSFFGVHAVVADSTGRAHLLAHGNTIHGAEWVRDEAGEPLTTRPVPASYFHAGGVYTQAINSVRAARGGKLERVAVVGLGMGSLACHARDGERWDFFEIDPEVVRLARDTRYFRSLSVCGPQAKIVLGDGRLTLADTEGGYDLIVLDAFSSDSVPVHLLTREALATYLSKLAPGGAIIFNISNRHMDLDAVVALSASANDLVTFTAIDKRAEVSFKQTLGLPAFVAVVARKPADLGAIAASPRWQRMVPSPADRAWTDDYSNILAPILRKYGWH
jgi:hypothetical protein